MTIQSWIEVPLVVVMVAGPAIILYHRLRDRKAGGDSPKGIGARVIQLIALLLLVPVVAILGLECKLGSEGIGTTLGVIIGYTLSGVSKALPSKKDSKGSESNEKKS